MPDQPRELAEWRLSIKARRCHARRMTSDLGSPSPPERVTARAPVPRYSPARRNAGRIIAFVIGGLVLAALLAALFFAFASGPDLP